MSEDRGISETDAAEEHTETDEGHSRGCFQVSTFCCCISRRKIYLPGRRPRDRKKKGWKKNNAEDPCLKDIMLEEGPQDLGQDHWRATFVEDLARAQTDTIQAGRDDPLSPLPLPLCIQSYDKKNQDQHMPVPLGTFSLEKAEEYDREKMEKTFHTPGESQQPKEGLHSLSACSAVTQKKNLVGIVTEGMPFKEGKDDPAMPDKENRQSESPELLSPLLQEEACEKGQEKGGICTGSMVEGEPCKMKLNQEDIKYAPLQEPQEPTDLEQLHSMLADNEKKSQEEQNNTGMDSQGVTSLQQLLGQPDIPCTEEVQHLEKQPVMGATHDIEERGQMDSAFEGGVHENTDGGDTAHQEAEQLGELKHPDILPAMDEGVHGVLEVLGHQASVSETSAQKREQDLHDLPLHEQKEQLPITSKATSFSFQDITYEKKQTDVQDIRNYTSDTILSKGEDHQYAPYHVDRQAAPTEYMPTFSLGTTYTSGIQRPAYTDCVPQDTAVYVPGQKQPDTQQLIFGQQIKTPHYHITDEKEEQEGLDHAYLGSKGIVCIEEQEYQEPVIFEDVSMLTDNLSYEKEQQRKLDCGDSGPESICDKDDQDHQPALYLEVQEPRVLGKLSSLSLNETFEEQHIRKDNTSADNLKMDEQQAEQDDQMLIFPSSKEKERIQGLEQPPLVPLLGCNMEGASLEAWHDQKATSITCEELKQREQLKLGLTCEEHHKKEKQGLSNTTFPFNNKEDEGHM